MHYTDDDAPWDARKADPYGMSLLDKMNMWEKNAGVDKPENDQGELFDGVGDAEEELIPPVEIPRYNKIILESSAYNWFITNLRKEYSLQRGATELRLAIDNIRQTILDKLPSGKVSKQRIPPRHRCTFRLLLAPLRARLYPTYEMYFTKKDIRGSCGDLLVQRGTSNDGQRILCPYVAFCGYISPRNSSRSVRMQL